MLGHECWYFYSVIPEHRYVSVPKVGIYEGFVSNRIIYDFFNVQEQLRILWVGSIEVSVINMHILHFPEVFFTITTLNDNSVYFSLIITLASNMHFTVPAVASTFSVNYLLLHWET